MKNTQVAIGIACSLAVGALIGILFAPGKNNHSKHKGNGWKDNVKDGFGSLASSMENDDDYHVSQRDRNIGEKKNSSQKMS